jgi:hypothetical protein
MDLVNYDEMEEFEIVGACNMHQRVFINKQKVGECSVWREVTG